jgi:hypothetical protein
MPLLNMRYKDFVFPSNPSKIEVLSSKKISEKPLINGDFNTDENSKNASVIKAQGFFTAKIRMSSCSSFQGFLMKAARAGFSCERALLQGVFQIADNYSERG